MQKLPGAILCTVSFALILAVILRIATTAPPATMFSKPAFAHGSTPWNRGRGLSWTMGGPCGTLVWSLNSKQEVSPHGPALPMVSQPTLPCLRPD